jgi:DEP domain-containing protein 5
MMAAGPPSKTCTVVLHDDSVSKQDVLCGANVLTAGSIARLSASKTKVLCIYCKGVTKNPDEVSVHVAVARQFGFENRMKARIELVDNIDDATANHVELFFRDQQLSRADMWRIKSQVDASVLYQGQKLKYLGSNTATIEAVYIAGQEVDSAYISNPQTKLIFRSGSARFTILIQVSKEMLEYWNDGDLMYERLTNGFLPDLFGRWDELKVKHTLSVVLFGRRLSSPSAYPVQGGGIVERHDNGEDFFRVIVANVPSTDWRRVLRKLKRAFNRITRSQQVSLATNGNMIEAISFAAMDFANDIVDPPFWSTGKSITAITAGSGLFRTDHELLRRTTTTLMGNSVGVDIVSLSPKPLHPVPLFQYQRNGRVEYALPHWADISYWYTKAETFDSAWLMPLISGDVSDISIPPWRKESENDSERNIAQAMDAFDDALFCSVGLKFSNMALVTEKREVNVPPSVMNARPSTPIANATQRNKDANEQHKIASDATSIEPGFNTQDSPKPKRAPPHPLMQAGRKISLGPRGLALSLGVASTTVSAHNVQHEKDTVVPLSPFSSNDNSSILARQIRDSLRRKPSQRSLASHAPADNLPTAEPISIRTEEQQKEADPADPASLIEKAVMDPSVSTDPKSNNSVAATPRAATGGPNIGNFDGLGDQSDATSPWLTLLNPCNPKRDNMRVASQYRQWQNIFPRAVSSGAFKWDSICTPAILPLMTENRISMTHLERHFDKSVRRLLAIDHSAHHALCRMVALRLIAGFQIVPVRSLPRAQLPSEQIDRMLLSLGDCYHEVRCLSDVELQVSEYNRSDNHDSNVPLSLEYAASVKPIAARKERSQTIAVDEDAGVANWPSLDDQVVNNTSADDLGRIQARFVLIPVEFSRAELHQRATSKELSDEERRLDGIQRLTQLWQRYRYFTDEDERHKSSMNKPKTSSTIERDPNPLAIEYQTRDPSAVVNVYGGSLNGHLANVESTVPLFAESEKYHSNNFDMVKLVKQMQEAPPVGVAQRDRRWFTRLHLKCFRGDEMTNWLLGVFKDLETREDAVALGNELMNKDIFTHVRGKHEFRDGNYFYQIRSAHRTLDYPDTAGLFAKGIGRSVPSTPVADLKHSPMTRATQVDSDSSSKTNFTPMLAPVDSGKKEVLLSQVMQYNVDPAKKSSQVEVVNLHYGMIGGHLSYIVETANTDQIVYTTRKIVTTFNLIGQTRLSSLSESP